MIELCCEYLSVWSIWLYAVIMWRTCFSWVPKQTFNSLKWQVERDSRVEDPNDDDVESEEESELESEDENPGFSRRLSVSSMETFWKEVNPPNTEDQINGKWIACIFLGRVANFFISKILQSYLSDSVEEGGFAVWGIGGMLLLRTSIFGPLKGIYWENGKWQFPQYPNVKIFFENIKKQNHEAMYNRFISNLFQG